jgi:hypothetical protein
MGDSVGVESQNRVEHPVSHSNKSKISLSQASHPQAVMSTHIRLSNVVHVRPFGLLAAICSTAASIHVAHEGLESEMHWTAVARGGSHASDVASELSHVNVPQLLSQPK